MDRLKIEGEYFFSLKFCPVGMGAWATSFHVSCGVGYAGFCNVNYIGCIVVCGVLDFISKRMGEGSSKVCIVITLSEAESDALWSVV